MAKKLLLTSLEAAVLGELLYRKRLQVLMPYVGDPPSKSKVAALLFNLISLPPSPLFDLVLARNFDRRFAE